jgi:hypothetical protein
MLTPGSVWADIPYNSGFCTEFYVLWPSACRPLSIFAKVDEAITKVETCQLLFPTVMLDRIAGWRADHISHGCDRPLSLRTSQLGTALFPTKINV